MVLLLPIRVQMEAIAVRWFKKTSKSFDRQFVLPCDPHCSNGGANRHHLLDIVVALQGRPEEVAGVVMVLWRGMGGSVVVGCVF